MNDLNRIRAFYYGSDADLLMARDGDGAGVIWTLPPSSPKVLLRAVQRMVRCKTTQFLWARKIRIMSRSRGEIKAFGIYSLPEGVHHIYRLHSGE